MKRLFAPLAATIALFGCDRPMSNPVLAADLCALKPLHWDNRVARLENVYLGSDQIHVIMVTTDRCDDRVFASISDLPQSEREELNRKLSTVLERSNGFIAIARVTLRVRLMDQANGYPKLMILEVQSFKEILNPPARVMRNFGVSEL